MTVTFGTVTEGGVTASSAIKRDTVKLENFYSYFLKARHVYYESAHGKSIFFLMLLDIGWILEKYLVTE